jgi:hypothetical protein
VVAQAKKDVFGKDFEVVVEVAAVEELGQVKMGDVGWVVDAVLAADRTLKDVFHILMDVFDHLNITYYVGVQIHHLDP